MKMAKCWFSSQRYRYCVLRSFKMIVLTLESSQLDCQLNSLLRTKTGKMTVYVWSQVKDPSSLVFHFGIFSNAYSFLILLSLTRLIGCS